MENPEKSPRELIPMILSIVVALILVSGFMQVLAARSALVSSGYLPIVLHEAGSPGGGTGTPTPTGTVTATATRTPTPTSTPVAGEGKVLIVNMAFQPAEITVHVGEKVEWENKDMVSHTTTSDTGAWDSGALAPDQKFTFVFNSLGDFPYHCSFHPEMTGIVHVVPNP